MGFEFDWRDIVKLLVDSPAVKPIVVIKFYPFNVFNVAPVALAMNQFGFVETAE